MNHWHLGIIETPMIHLYEVLYIKRSSGEFGKLPSNVTFHHSGVIHPDAHSMSKSLFWNSGGSASKSARICLVRGAHVLAVFCFLLQGEGLGRAEADVDAEEGGRSSSPRCIPALIC